MIVAQQNDIEHQWSQIRSMLRAEVGDPAFATWLKPLDLAALDGDRVVIAVPTQFMRDWVVAHYADRIRALWTSINPMVRSIPTATTITACERLRHWSRRSLLTTLCWMCPNRRWQPFQTWRSISVGTD